MTLILVNLTDELIPLIIEPGVIVEKLLRFGPHLFGIRFFSDRIVILVKCVYIGTFGIEPINDWLFPPGKVTKKST
ncbi:MAG: hypothetical protein V5A77_07265 [Candidatus Bipolaricaulota bacterium]